MDSITTIERRSLSDRYGVHKVRDAFFAKGTKKEEIRRTFINLIIPLILGLIMTFIGLPLIQFYIEGDGKIGLYFPFFCILLSLLYLIFINTKEFIKAKNMLPVEFVFKLKDKNNLVFKYLDETFRTFHELDWNKVDHVFSSVLNKSLKANKQPYSQVLLVKDTTYKNEFSVLLQQPHYFRDHMFYEEFGVYIEMVEIKSNRQTLLRTSSGRIEVTHHEDLTDEFLKLRNYLKN